MEEQTVVVTNPLLPIVVRYAQADPVAAAHNIETLSEEHAIEVLESLLPSDLKKVLVQLSPSFISGIVQTITPERVAPILEKGGSAVCASVLLILPEQMRTEFLSSMSDELREEIQEFLTFPEDSAGRMMNTDYTAFHHRATVKQAVSQLRARVGIQRAPSNIFVIDDEHKLLGVIRMRDMLIAEEDTLLKELMNADVFTVSPFDEKAEAFRILSGRGFTSLPVVDSQGHLLGVVRATNLLEEAKDTASRDIQKLFGVGKDERTFSPIGFSLRKRLPWLHVNLATAFLAASVVALFEGVIAKITILAVYLPVVAGQGGNAGAQSLALVMRGLVMREIPSQEVKRMLLKESIIGAINGVVIGLVTAAIAWLWNGNIYLGLVIGVAMIINLAVAGFSGAVIPITMKRLGLDPAQSSSIVLTTITDVVGFFAFLAIAMLLQNLLI